MIDAEGRIGAAIETLSDMSHEAHSVIQWPEWLRVRERAKTPRGSSRSSTRSFAA